MPVLVLYLIQQLPESDTTFERIIPNRLVAFLYAVQAGYKQQITYHNDLHAADVAQMMFYIL